MIRPILFSVGILYGLLALAVKSASGPYWLSPNLDPSYAYLISGLQILVRELPGQYEHPGTPLQILIAFLISVLNISKDWDTIVLEVLRHPETYLNATWIVLACLAVVSIWSVCFFAYRLTQDLIFSLCLCLPSFIFLTFKCREHVDLLIPAAANVSPENVFISLCNFYAIYALFFLSRKGSGHHREAVYWGIVCGVSLMIKLTFAPLLLLPFTVLATRKERGYFVGACLLSAFVSTLPLISIYPEVFGWFGKLQSHSGWYGRGEAGFISLATFVPNLFFLFGKNMFLIVLSVLAILCLFMKSNQREDAGQFWVTKRHWLCFIVMWGSSFLLFAKMPSSHYLLPGYGLSGLFLGLVYKQLRPYPHRKILAVIVVAAIFFLSVRTITYAEELSAKMIRLGNFSRQIRKDHPNCLIINYYRSSAVNYALFFGNSWYFRNTFSAQLEKLYPDSYFYDHLRGQISNYTEFIPAAELKKKYPCMMLFGDHDGHWESEVLLKVAQQDGERLYLLKLP